jgi:outer membrane receptor protein involved in Fe transport
VGAAARYSDYSDFGSASTGKLSARYKFNEQFLLRGSVSNSFRAPALVQTGFRFSRSTSTATAAACRPPRCCRPAIRWRARSAHRR